MALNISLVDNSISSLHGFDRDDTIHPYRSRVLTKRSRVLTERSRVLTERSRVLTERSRGVDPEQAEE
jgi:hypothetical protein